MATPAKAKPAANVAGAPKYYVYHLVDPRNGRVFYVGKGSGNRVMHHERDALNLRFLNSEKEGLIHQIWEEGLQVASRIVARFESEAMAYCFEKSEINRIGMENLTNLSRGGEPSALKAMRRAEAFVSVMKAARNGLSCAKKKACDLLIAEMEENISYCKTELGCA